MPADWRQRWRDQRVLSSLEVYMQRSNWIVRAVCRRNYAAIPHTRAHLPTSAQIGHTLCTTVTTRCPVDVGRRMREPVDSVPCVCPDCWECRRAGAVDDDRDGSHRHHCHQHGGECAGAHHTIAHHIISSHIPQQRRSRRAERRRDRQRSEVCVGLGPVGFRGVRGRHPAGRLVLRRVRGAARSRDPSRHVSEHDRQDAAGATGGHRLPRHAAHRRSRPHRRYQGRHEDHVPAR